MNNASTYEWKLSKDLVPGDLVIMMWIGDMVEAGQQLTELEQASAKMYWLGMVIANDRGHHRLDDGEFYVWLFKEKTMKAFTYNVDHKIVSVS